MTSLINAAIMVESLRFKPLGRRSIAGNYHHFGFKVHTASETTTMLNDATLLVAMIETPEAIENIDAIAAVPGINILLMGTNDLCLEMGIPSKVDHPEVSTAID